MQRDIHVSLCSHACTRPAPSCRQKTHKPPYCSCMNVNPVLPTHTGKCRKCAQVLDHQLDSSQRTCTRIHERITVQTGPGPEPCKIIDAAHTCEPASQPASRALLPLHPHPRVTTHTYREGRSVSTRKNTLADIKITA